MAVYMVLAHHPVYNKRRETVASAVTMIDLHDLARVAATYAAGRLFVVTPLEDQRRLAERMIGHWREGWGEKYNPDRGQALSLVRLTKSIGEAAEAAAAETGQPVIRIGTSAVGGAGRLTFPAARGLLRGPRPVMMIFGTAWGLTEEALAECEHILEPVDGTADYNHLSVRSAAAVVMDRLAGSRT